MLILFDIDGTMLSSEGVGVRSMEQTGEVMFGKPFSLSGVPIGGRLDPLIWKDACKHHGIKDHASHHEEFRSQYAEILCENLKNTTVTILPGIAELLQQLTASTYTLGLVTGNYKETGLLKLEAASIDTAPFVANAWGTDGSVRADLPLHAIAQHDKLEPVVLIGDTSHCLDGQAATAEVDRGRLRNRDTALTATVARRLATVGPYAVLAQARLGGTLDEHTAVFAAGDGVTGKHRLGGAGDLYPAAAFADRTRVHIDESVVVSRGGREHGATAGKAVGGVAIGHGGAGYEEPAAVGGVDR